MFVTECRRVYWTQFCSTSTLTTRTTYLPSWLHGEKNHKSLLLPLGFYGFLIIKNLYLVFILIRKFKSVKGLLIWLFYYHKLLRVGFFDSFIIRNFYSSLIFVSFCVAIPPFLPQIAGKLSKQVCLEILE